jgi:hypothetical protein
MYWGRIILNADSLPTSIYVCRGKRDMNGERIILTLKIKIQMSKFKR